MPQITGYKIREALKTKASELEALRARFNPSLTYFESDGEKPEVLDLALEIAHLEGSIARLQALQAQYNLQVEVTVTKPVDQSKKTMPLLVAIKVVGGVGRMEKMWRAASAPYRDRYSYHETVATREKDTEMAKRTVSYDDAREQAKMYGKYASSLRMAIAEGNATKFDVTDAEFRQLFA